MRHPLQSIPSSKLGRVLVPLIGATCALEVILVLIDRPLETSEARAGIVSYELAGSAQRSNAILGSWNAAARVWAGFSLGIDFLFIPVYSTTIALACLWSAGVMRARGVALAPFGIALAWGLWLAAVCDMTENAGLLVQLVRAPSEVWAKIAAGCATVKFLFVAAGLVYATAGALVRLLPGGAATGGSSD